MQRGDGRRPDPWEIGREDGGVGGRMGGGGRMGEDGRGACA